MRRLSMKNKRKKSETASDSDAEENGVTRSVPTDGADTKKEGEAEETDSESSEKAMNARKSPGKRRMSRGRLFQKVTSEERTGEDESTENDSPSVSDEEENSNTAKGGVNKRRKREGQRASTSANENSSANEKEYEVEKIVGQRTVKGRRQFLVRWKGYSEDSDTWEQEKELKCAKLIEKYLEEAEDDENDEEHEVPAKVAKSKSSKKEEKKSRRSKANSKKAVEDRDTDASDEENDKDSQKEFEVEKILEVHFKKNKTREFLIRWKGFTAADDTWEPEKNLNCPDLIEKFMQKVEQAKQTDMRELRANRVHTKRYTLSTPETGRRLSRRNMAKQRATYHECDD